ncbi:hypothetical protein [Rhodococcus oryzae]|uniref:hypothetical protein n=1 Tax=Rhodococcus oryzae TaxID=2571143 RepID=UPI0037BCEF13
MTSIEAITKADNELDTVLAAAMDAKEQTDRAAQGLAQDLTVAQSQITAAKDYINTRRGAIGARALRLAQGDEHSQRYRPDAGSHGAPTHQGYVRPEPPIAAPGSPRIARINSADMAFLIVEAP